MRGCVRKIALLRGAVAEVDCRHHTTGLVFQGAHSNIGIAYNIAIVAFWVAEGPEGVQTGALDRAEPEFVGFNCLTTAEAELRGAVHSGRKCE